MKAWSSCRTGCVTSHCSYLLLSLLEHLHLCIACTRACDCSAAVCLTRSPLGRQMMQNLLLEEGDITTVRSATLRKGTYVKLQPHTKVRFRLMCGLRGACAESPACACAAHKRY